MNTLGNNNKHRYLATLAYSAGRVCSVLALALVFTLSLAGGVARAAPKAPAAPFLGTASNFAVLSAAPKPDGAVSLSNSTVTGDVGSSGPMASVVLTEGSTIAGAIIAPVSDKVLRDFNRAYDAFADVPCDTVLTGTLAGVTLEPGVYCFDAAAVLTGQLTLQGPSDGIWIFKIGTSGTGALTGTNFSVVMDGGLSCNVYWWVAQAATMTTSNFVGTILAGAAITINYGTFIGDALAKAAVTMTGATLVGCMAGNGGGESQSKCNQGVGNGPENCDPGYSNQGDPSRSNDELGGMPGKPGRMDGNIK